MKNVLSPSLLAADYAHMGQDVLAAEKGGAKYLHIDVMDGLFVPSISFGPAPVKGLRKLTDMVFDVHLMIVNPEQYIQEFAKAGADIITIHAEATNHVNRALNMIRECGVKAGIALNPATPLSVLEYVLEDVDMVLLMSVNPGFGGQSYIPGVTRKIRDLRKMLDDRGLDVDIEVDGGVKLSNVETVLDAGANVIVAGSAVFGPATEENARAFMNILSAKG